MPSSRFLAARIVAALFLALSAAAASSSQAPQPQGANNLLVNGQFHSNLSGWLDFPTDSWYPLDWRTRDADGSSTSGSMYVKSKISAGFLDNVRTGAQCIPLSPGRTYDASAAIYVPTPAEADGGTNHDGSARLRLRLFDAGQCGGNPVTTLFSGGIDETEAGAWHEVTLPFTTAANVQSGWIQPYAANASPPLDDPDPFEVHFDAMDLRRRYADLALDLAPRETSIQTNRNIVVDVEVSHLGPTTETPSNVLVSIARPSGLDFVSAPNCPGTVTLNGGVIEWTIPSIASGQTLACDPTFFVPTNRPPGNAPLAAVMSPFNDPVSANNQVEAPLTIESSRDIAIEMQAHRDDLSSGDTVRLDLALSNTGNVAVDNETVVLELLEGQQFPPPDYPFMAVSDCPQSTIDTHQNGDVEWSFFGTLEPGESTGCRIAVTMGDTGGDQLAVADTPFDEVDPFNDTAFAAINRRAASTFSVTSDQLIGDASPGDGQCEATLVQTCTLWAAIEEANALPGTDRIELPAGSFRLNSGGATGPAITDSVIITGAGIDATTITASSSVNGVIHVDGSGHPDVTLRRLSISGGENANGGAIEQTAGLGSLVLEQVRISDSIATSSGGGVWSQANLAIVDSSVADNTAASLGGGVHFNAAAGQGMLRIQRSTVSGNTATNGGGVASTPGAGSPLTLEAVVSNSTISGNSASNAGGGLHASFGGQAFIMNSTITENDADQAGGGLFAGLTSELRLWNATVTNNLYNTFISDGGLGGGGIYVDNLSSATVSNSILLGNSKSGIFVFPESLNCGGTALELERTNIIQITSVFNGPDFGCSVSGQTSDRIEAGFDATLATLADNGGPTLSHLPLPSGPAIDAGTSADCYGDWPGPELGPMPVRLESDQRGLTRVVDGDESNGAQCDPGSVESGGEPLVDLLFSDRFEAQP
jgi:hypothetical protein